MIYEIKIKGLLDQSWSAWLGDLEIRVRRKRDGSVITTLITDVMDQTTLFGVIDRIRDLNLFLVSVNPKKSSGSR